VIGQTNGAAAVEATDIVKNFGSLRALCGTSLSLYRGEITAVIGDNGAGKSTLLKVLSGEHLPDGGQLRFGGELTELHSTADAQDLGVETVYQDLSLAPDLSVSENVFLGREVTVPGWRGRLGTLDRSSMLAETQHVLANLGITLKSYRAPTRSLSGGQRQAVAVARAMKWARHAILMDEPTAALGARQKEMVYDAIRSAAKRDLAVLLISHDIPQVLRLANRIVVLRHGKDVTELDPADVDVRDVVHVMLGGEARAG
jgi:ABC-type sugar transport system ATPase subunit